MNIIKPLILFLVFITFNAYSQFNYPHHKSNKFKKKEKQIVKNEIEGKN